MLPTVRIVSPVSDDNPLGFVVIDRADFSLELHEPLDASDLEGLAPELPLTVSGKVLDEARAEFQRMHADLVTERERLDAQAAEQEVERQRLATLAGDLEAERDRLSELAAKLAAQEEAKPLGIAALRDELTARGIAFDPAAKKADLQALLDA
jgi:hypothetical protein